MDFKVVAYLPSWTEKYPDTLRFDIVTHVNYAFAIPTKDGKLLPLQNESLAETTIREAHRNGRKACLSVGGWSHEDILLEGTFAAATESDAKLRSFADEVLSMCGRYGFDGIDMDWEYPRSETIPQYEELMTYLSEKLHREGKILTCAVTAGVNYDGTIQPIAYAQTETVIKAVDWINIMAYDGGDGADHSGYAFTLNCADFWLKTRNVPKEKAVLGIPFYGRPDWIPYSALLNADRSAYEKDAVIYNNAEVHYNGIKTVYDKTRYAAENMGGVMIWEITQDTTDTEKSLLTSVQNALK